MYDRFRELLIERTVAQRVGLIDDDDLGPVIATRASSIRAGGVDQARTEGAEVLAGGERLGRDGHNGGFYG